MVKVTNIHSVTDFARNTREHLERLAASGEPEVLTINGKAAVVVQDAEAYQKLLDKLDYAESVRTLRQRLESFKKDKRGRPMRKAIEDLARHAGVDLG
jgi:PHD/YefM family antitoxin component YafN of YafNO toxin-antitoxin module